MKKAAFLFAHVLTFCLATSCFGQIIGGGGGGPDPVPFIAANNNGYIQNGINGADNLVMFNVIPMLPTKKIPEPFAVPMPFTIIGDLSAGQDINGDGIDDSLGTFSGLEWSSGEPFKGSLIGCVLNEGNGNGEFYQINPITAQPSLIGQGPLDKNGNSMVFSDLAYNPADGLMYGLMNDITLDGDDVVFGRNSLWVDTDGNLIPDTKFGDGISELGGGPLETLASGLAFDNFGSVYIYDSIDERILAGGSAWDLFTFFGVWIAGNPNPINVADDTTVAEFDNNDTGLTSSEAILGNGLAVVGAQLFIASDIEGVSFGAERETIISFYDIPIPLPKELPEIYPATTFQNEFFEEGFFANIAVGDLVSADADFSDLPPTFPDNVVVNNGTPDKDAILEAVVVADDFHFGVTAATPTPSAAPVDVSFIFTIPNPSSITTLGIEIESHANVINLEHSVLALNNTTGEYDDITTSLVSFDTDNDFTAVLTPGIADYVDQSNGTLMIRIATRAIGPTAMFPWKVEYDAVLAVSE